MFCQLHLGETLAFDPRVLCAMLQVDVREQQELTIAPFPHPVRHLPLSDAEQWMGSIDEVLPQGGSIVVLCHAGVRSWNFGCWLLDNRPSLDVWNLEGGIDAWSVEVDSSVPRY